MKGRRVTSTAVSPPDQAVRIVGFAGSLREGSFNRALLRTACQLAPPGVHIEIVELDEIPMFSQDTEADGDPDVVRAFKATIAAADGLLIATPEYQRGIPGALKNALDWASRPADDSVMRGKVAAILGATPGAWGTARAQEQLRQTLGFTGTYTVLEPEVLIADASRKFDHGELVDDESLMYVGLLLDELVGLIERLRR
jgi:chromate reductase